MEQALGFGIVFFAGVGVLQMGLLTWRFFRRENKGEEKCYVIDANGGVRSMVSTDADAKLLRAIERIQTA